MRNNEKGAVPLVLLIILLLLAGGGAYLVSMSSSQSSEEDASMAATEAPAGVGTSVVEPAAPEIEAQSGEVTESPYRGAVLAGAASPLRNFAKEDYEAARASGKLIVLYFYASWCPICKVETASALYPAFNELSQKGVIGFRVNYNDNETDADERALAREFGVVYQHTKVFIKNGTRILKSPEGWDKARYLAEIAKAI